MQVTPEAGAEQVLRQLARIIDPDFGQASTHLAPRLVQRYHSCTRPCGPKLSSAGPHIMVLENLISPEWLLGV